MHDGPFSYLSAIKEAGGNCITVQGDMTNEKDVEHLMRTTMDKCVLCPRNAGTSGLWRGGRGGPHSHPNEDKGQCSMTGTLLPLYLTCHWLPGPWQIPLMHSLATGQ